MKGDAALAALLIATAGCGGGTDGTSAALPTAPATAPTPAPTPPPAPEPEPPPEPPIEITPVGSGISFTAENQIVLELMPEDIVPANPLDLAGRTLIFTPAGSGYSREVRPLDRDDDLGNPVDDNEEIEAWFRFEFAGRQWESFVVSRYGLVTFGEPYPFPRHGPDRFGTMAENAEHLGAPPMIAALYKPQLGGFWGGEPGNAQHISRRPDRVIVTGCGRFGAGVVRGTPVGAWAPVCRNGGPDDRHFARMEAPAVVNRTYWSAPLGEVQQRHIPAKNEMHRWEAAGKPAEAFCTHV